LRKLTLSDLRKWAKQLRQKTYALYLAYRDPRVPWYAKLFGALVVAYAFSPIDLIPDFIPVLGYLDDLVLIPLGIALAIRMIPRPVMEECLSKAEQAVSGKRTRNWIAGGVIIAIWLLLLSAVGVGIARRILR
jgi:uncharacterized membrane protein YkvA (DUF1232 family)